MICINYRNYGRLLQLYNGSEVPKVRGEVSVGGQGLDADREDRHDFGNGDLWEDMDAHYWSNVTLVDGTVGRILKAVVQT